MKSGYNDTSKSKSWNVLETVLSHLKARANAGPNMLRAFAHHVVCCCVLLRLIGSCWMKFETGETSEHS